MVAKLCNLCGRNDTLPLVLDEPVSQTGAYVICKNCGLIYHETPMTDAEMAAFYRNEYADAYQDSKAMQIELAEKRIAFLRQHVRPAELSPALEIGCAGGEFLQQLRKQDVAVCGVEPSVALSQLANDERGLSVSTGVYDDFPERPERYGLICMFHVLEHLANPSETLIRVRSELRPGGKLFVIVPTLGATQLSTVFKTIHPTTFVRETLAAMLAKTSFEIDSVRESGYHLTVLASPGKMPLRFDYPDAEAIHERVLAYLAERRKIMSSIRSTLKLLEVQTNIAVYGAGHNTLDLHRHFDLSKLNITQIFDADPRKQGQKVIDLTVQAPEALRNFSGSSVIISSYAYQEEIYAQLNYLTERGVQLIRLYEKPVLNCEPALT